MERTCANCACNKICDHNQFGFETCNNWIDINIINLEKKVYFPRHVAAAAIHDWKTAGETMSEAMKKAMDIVLHAIGQMASADLVFMLAAMHVIYSNAKSDLDPLQASILDNVEKNAIMVRVDKAEMERQIRNLRNQRPDSQETEDAV